MKMPKKRGKKAQTWSLEVFMAIMVFLIATVMFYSIIYTTPNNKELSKEAGLITKSISSNELFEDGLLTEDEAQTLAEKNCEELKQYFNTNKKICVYIKNQKGEIVPLSPEVKVAGCPGIDIGDIKCGEGMESCNDEKQNQDETDVDCGGKDCSDQKCAIGQKCEINGDCQGATEGFAGCNNINL